MAKKGKKEKQGELVQEGQQVVKVEEKKEKKKKKKIHYHEHEEEDKPFRVR